MAHWEGDRLRVSNFATRQASLVGPLVLELLARCGRWRTERALLRELGALGEPDVRRALKRLCERGLLCRSDRPVSAAERGWDALASWNPAVGFYHAAAKDVRYVPGLEANARYLRERLAVKAAPSSVRRVSGAPALALEPASGHGELRRALLDRRTWRRFGRAPLPTGCLAELLGLSFGVQRWLDLGELGRLPLKTAPSGGARHPVEAYVAVRSVEGIPAGLYHYSADRHALERIKRGGGRERLSRYLPGQRWYASASALVVLTAVFTRAEWPYPYPRTYRAVAFEAGHLCQTFCLVATQLGLAPFCTDALADSQIEAELGIDGVTEAPLYAVGVGRQPRGVSWAPWPDTRRLPRTVTPRRARTRSR